MRRCLEFVNCIPFRRLPFNSHFLCCFLTPPFSLYFFLSPFYCFHTFCPLFFFFSLSFLPRFQSASLDGSFSVIFWWICLELSESVDIWLRIGGTVPWLVSIWRGVVRVWKKLWNQLVLRWCDGREPALCAQCSIRWRFSASLVY